MEKEFLQTWCVVMTSTQAIVEADKLEQKDDDHIRIYAAQFDEYRQFFKDCVDNHNCIEMCLNHVRDILKVHTISMQNANYSWKDFKKAIFELDN